MSALPATLARRERQPRADAQLFYRRFNLHNPPIPSTSREAHFDADSAVLWFAHVSEQGLKHGKSSLELD